jgi:hypothetical protein
MRRPLRVIFVTVATGHRAHPSEGRADRLGKHCFHVTGNLQDMDGVDILAAFDDERQRFTGQFSKKKHCHGRRLSLQRPFPGAASWIKA